MLLEQGRALAQQLGEKWWVLYYDYRLYDLAMYYILDYKTGLDLAVKNAVEVRKPEYQGCPFAGTIYRSMVDAYVMMDPIGYEAKIREATAYLDTEVQLDKETWRLIPSEYGFLALALDQLEEAHSAAQRYLERAENSDFQTVYAHEMLCYICYLQGDFDNLNQFAQLGETHARRIDSTKLGLSIMLLWQAVYAQKKGAVDEGKRLYITATSNTQKLGVTAIESYYDALCAYLEACDDFGLALKVREQALQSAIKWGSPYSHTEAHLECCRLLAKMGLLREEHLTAARDAAKELIAPARFLAKLEKYQVSPDVK